MAQASAATPEAPASAPASKPVRKPLPDHLPHEPHVHEPSTGACNCPQCGGTLRALGEDVSEVLEYVPEDWKVHKHVRPKYSCGTCQRIVQASAPSRPIERSYAGPGLLAHVLVSKYCDHIPLYRRARSMPDRASSSIEPHSPSGLDRPAPWSIRCSAR